MKLPFPEDDRLRHFPVNVCMLAKQRGIEVRYKILPRQIGAILHKFKRQSYLYVNTNDSSVRRRFTIANEIAHHMLHPAGVYMVGPGVLTEAMRIRQGSCLRRKGNGGPWCWDDRAERLRNIGLAEVLGLGPVNCT